jgi:probable F420-dependent oxidoreductase
MKYGIFFGASERTMPFAEVAIAAEQRGFESIWVPEHTHIPTSRRTRFPGGGEIPRSYSHTVDPFVTLASAAAVTKTIKLATGVCLVVERDPIVLAKEAATLDLVSNGRLILGIGAGWNVEEMENHGTAFRTRWKLLRERVEAMKRIWADEEPEYHGEFVNFDPLWSYPKPVQKPHPPILLGGSGSAVLKRVVNYCDGWMPVRIAIPSFLAALPELRRLAEEKGRDPKSISLSMFWAPADRAVIDQLEQAGVQRAILSCKPGQADIVMPQLDKLAKLAGA